LYDLQELSAMAENQEVIGQPHGLWQRKAAVFSFLMKSRT